MSAPGPVGYQCGNIDAVIAKIGDVDKIVDDLRDELRNLAQMGAKRGELETVRSACEELREWGQEQQDLAKELEKEVSKLTDDLAEANDTIAELRRELESALA